MDPRVTLITLGYADVDAAHRFYLEGLGWPAILHVPGDVAFVQVAPGVALALWRADALAADIGPDEPVGSPAAGAVALAQNVGSPEEVAAVLDRAAAAGGTVLKPAQRAFFGGVQGYFADPGGARWEVAWNPGLRVADDGTITMEGPDDDG
ncbi:MAG TPA: VOC family protein [Acidimicrobiales bacterium]|jgi:catechol 2,3-dioxygenase-like lactoylglutathione lyase family enzyme